MFPTRIKCVVISPGSGFSQFLIIENTEGDCKKSGHVSAFFALC